MPLERVRTAGLTDAELAALRDKWKPAEHALVFSGVLGAIVGVVLVLTGLGGLTQPERMSSLCAFVAGVAMVLGGRWAWNLDRRARPAMLVAALAWGITVWMIGAFTLWSLAPVALAAVPWGPFGFVMSDEYRLVVVPVAVSREGTRFVRYDGMIVVAVLAIVAAIVIPNVARCGRAEPDATGWMDQRPVPRPAPGPLRDPMQVPR